MLSVSNAVNHLQVKDPGHGTKLDVTGQAESLPIACNQDRLILGRFRGGEGLRVGIG